MAPAAEGVKRPGILKTGESNDASASPAGGILGLQQTASPKSTPKSVSIAPTSELISPMMLGGEKDVDDFDLDRGRSPRKIRAKGPGSLRLSGRPPAPQSSASSSTIQQWLETDKAGETADSESIGSRSEHHYFDHGIVGKIVRWARDEKIKGEARRARRNAKRTSEKAAAPSATAHASDDDDDDDDDIDMDTLDQILKESRISKSRLSRKLSTSGRHRHSTRRLHRASSIAASSDTDFVDGDVLVPSAEVVLDNAKTLSYKGGAAKSTDDLTLTRQQTASEDVWQVFKLEVLRVVHTLRLKGWRRIPLEISSEIGIERLSGALTNAVYVVHPPDHIPTPQGETEDPTRPRKKPAKLLLRIYGPQVEHLIDRESELQILRRLARKHIGPRMLGTFQNGRFEEYFNACPLNPQEMRNSDTSRHIAKRMRELHDGVELLDSERDDGPFVWRNWDKWLARVQKIVTWMDNKVKDDEPVEGKEKTFVCGTEWAVFHDTLFAYRQWLEKQCGGKQKLAKALVFAHNDTQYGNILRLLPSKTSPLLLPANSHKQLIVIDFEYANANTIGLEFANHFSEWCYNYHDEARPWACNAALYPTPEDQERFIRAYTRHRPDINVHSPKLDPLSTVPESRAVSPKPPSPMDGSGTDERGPHPTNSISQTLQHARNPSGASASNPAGPILPPPSTTTNPQQQPTSSHAQSPSTLLLPRPSSGSARSMQSEKSAASLTPSDMSSYAEWEDREIERLMKQTRLWRMANSAQWVAWGIVQAKIPGCPGEDEDEGAEGEGSKDDTAGVAPNKGDDEGKAGGDGNLDKVVETPTEEKGDADADAEADADADADEEFDYLSYARDRAMLFWGDAVELGFVDESDLPTDVRRDLKRLNY
ncbi:hypothetical protein CAC42_7600 [Sphaceloma murrayae]|uniref:Choline kinase N-terminal domain-containing protein n=1 Tax=Sphaceloma murrayae TaxID=2082308 RepID=A0A2K1QT63_9PEZI|nr:hypothetical protein CAC42_7600 [Sphaceloma murrayae]